MNNIYLLEIGDVKDFDWKRLGSDLQKIFGFSVKKIGPIEVPDFAFDEFRDQYDSLRIIRDLERLDFDDMEKLLGVTSKDLFTDNFNYIFGQGDSPGRLSLVATFRLDPRFYKNDFKEDILYSRVLKESIHELGHNFSLSHCPDSKCPMHFSNNVKDTDMKKTELCEKCENLLRMLK